KKLSCPHSLPILNVNCPNHAGFERLDKLGTTTWNNLTRSYSHNISGAESRPRNRQAKQRYYRHPDNPTRWRGWCLSDLECGRTKSELVIPLTSRPLRERNDFPNGSHGYRPAGNGALHIVHCCGSARHVCHPPRCDPARS